MKISVVTITLNRLEFLRKAIESVLAQRYSDFEHIVIDGGSTDGSLELLKSYPHLIWISEPDEGQADAMNKGLKRINGEIFAWLNSDDTYPPGTFDRVADHFRFNPDVGLIYGTCLLVNGRGMQIGKTNYNPFLLDRLIMGFNNINTPAVFVRTSALKSVGYFNLKLRATYDVDMWIRIAQRFSVLAVPDPLSNLCLHEGSGLVGTRLHLGEMNKYRQKWWKENRSTKKYVMFPYFWLREWLYYKLKFSKYLKKI